MPIHGRTSGYEAGRGIPELARLFKGEARDPNRPKWTPPERVDFRVEWTAAYVRYADWFSNRFGESVIEIPGVMLMGETPEKAFPNWMEEWAAGNRLVRRCDGEQIIDQFDTATQRTERDVHLQCVNSEAHPCGCKQVGRLRFVLPEFVNATGAIGCFSLVTHGWYDIMQIDATIKDAYQLYGTLKGIPFVLYRKQVELGVPYKDKTTGEMKRTTRIFNMALLRPQDGYINGSLQLPEFTPRMMESGDHPQLTGGHPAFNTPESVKTFHAAMAAEFEGITGAQLAEALSITKWSEYVGTIQDAAAQVRAWVGVPPDSEMPA